MYNTGAMQESISWQQRLPKPEPSLGSRAYQHELELALAHSDRRRENYNKYKTSVRCPELNYLPIKLDIENVSRCNFHCTMCQVSQWANHQRAADMRFEDFRNLLDAQYGLVEIKIQGMGEPTLGGDTFYQMIKYARDQHIWVRVITNASLLHINNNYQKLIDSGANEIQISIDGATKKTFESIRRGSRFEKVCENCKLINEYAKANHMTPTKMWTVVQRSNLCDLPGLVELAYNLGFQHLVFSLELQDWGQDEWLRINAALSARQHLTLEMASDLVHKGNTLGIKVAFWTVKTKYKAGKVGQLCPWPFERAYISSDMYIVPCCMIGNPDVSNLGNAHYFANAWNGEAYKRFRNAHLEGNIPRICLGCYEV